MSPSDKSQAAPADRKPRRWSQKVTEHSDALDLTSGVFAERDPKKIASSLKRSAEKSDRRKSSPFRSAMSMLTFYLNRAGRKLPATQRRRIEAAKAELRRMFGRPDPGGPAHRPPARRGRPVRHGGGAGKESA